MKIKIILEDTNIDGEAGFTCTAQCVDGKFADPDKGEKMTGAEIVAANIFQYVKAVKDDVDKSKKSKPNGKIITDV